MPATTFTVRRALQPRDGIAFVSLREDFALGDQTSTAIDSIKTNPNISLYAFDLPHRRAVFVEVPEQASVLDGSLPFFFQQQRALARRVHVVSFDELQTMAAGVSRRPDSVLLVYSTGRCGSTLLAGILSRASKTVVLSEPDMFTQLRSNAISERERQALARQATSLLLERFGGNDARVVIKFRSQVCHLWPSLDAGLSNPPSLFMYRNAIDVVQSYDHMNSSMRGMTRWLFKAPVVSTLARVWSKRRLIKMSRAMNSAFASILVDCSPADVVSRSGLHGTFLLRWLRNVDAYLRALERSPGSVAALRYEDLMRDERMTVGALFARFGWPEDEVEHCCGATQRHSQENTRLVTSSASGRLDRRSVEILLEIVEKHSRVGDAYALLPGTIQPSPLPQDAPGADPSFARSSPHARPPS